MIGVWVLALGVIAFAVINRRRRGTEDDDLIDEENGETIKRKRRRGFFEMMDAFPEFDLLIIIGTLILPWATAIVPYLMDGNTNDYIAVAESLPTVVYNVIFAISETLVLGSRCANCRTT